MPISDTISTARQRGADDDTILSKIEEANPKLSQPIQIARQRGAGATQILEKIAADNPGTQKLGSPTVGNIVGEAGKRFMGRAEKAADVFAEPGLAQKASGVLQTAGAAAGAVGEVGAGLLGKAVSAVTPDVIEDPIRKLGGEVIAKAADAELVKKAVSFAERHPQASANIGAALDVAGLAFLNPTQKVAGAVAGKAAKTGEAVAAKVAKTVAPSPEKLGKQITKKVFDVVRPDKGEWQELAFGSKGADKVARVIAEVKAVPDVTPDFKQDWSKAIRSNITPAIKQADTELSALLKEVPPTVQGSWSGISRDAAKAIEKSFGNAEDILNAKKELRKQLAAERARFPRPIMEDLNTAKRGMWDVGFDSERPLRNKVARLIGHAMKDQIEAKAEKAGVNASRIRELNEKMGDLVTARALLENATGRVVNGGKMGDYFAATIGASVGSAVGHAVPGVGPLIGGGAGFAIAQKGERVLRKTLPGRAMRQAAKLGEKATRAETEQMQSLIRPR